MHKNNQDETNERLAIVQEEMAEAISMISKAERHGMNSSHPDYNNIPNRELIAMEIGHSLAAIDMMCAANDIERADVEKARRDKLMKLKRFTHYQDWGRLQL